jgi:hypothetical protein
MNWNVNGYAIGVGFLIALVVLVVCIVKIASDGNQLWLDLIAALAIARMVP